MEMYTYGLILTPAGDATDLDNLQSSTFVGIDAEAWNLNGKGSKSNALCRNMGKMKITDLLGVNAYSAFITPLSILMQIIYFFSEAITTYHNKYSFA
jgi:hypothetical protein